MTPDIVEEVAKAIAAEVAQPRYALLDSPTSKNDALWACMGLARAAIEAIDRLRAAVGWQGDSAPAGAGPLPAVPLSRAASDVLAERRRQIDIEGWTPEHDDGHSSTDAFGRFSSRPSGLAIAAACYALGAAEIGRQRFQPAIKLWPWDLEWWKPKDPRRNLVRAGALILAEIDRLDRIDPPGTRGVEDSKERGHTEPPQSSSPPDLPPGEET